MTEGIVGGVSECIINSQSFQGSLHLMPEVSRRILGVGGRIVEGVAGAQSGKRGGGSPGRYTKRYPQEAYAYIEISLHF